MAGPTGPSMANRHARETMLRIEQLACRLLSAFNVVFNRFRCGVSDFVFTANGIGGDLARQVNPPLARCEHLLRLLTGVQRAGLRAYCGSHAQVVFRARPLRDGKSWICASRTAELSCQQRRAIVSG
jgi:hypothetical protein